MKIDIHYSNPDYPEDGEYTATFNKDQALASEVIEWLASAFDTFGFGAVSVRIDEERAHNLLCKQDKMFERLVEDVNRDEHVDKLVSILDNLQHVEYCTDEMGLGYSVPPSLRHEIDVLVERIKD